MGAVRLNLQAPVEVVNGTACDPTKAYPACSYSFTPATQLVRACAFPRRCLCRGALTALSLLPVRVCTAVLYPVHWFWAKGTRAA